MKTALISLITIFLISCSNVKVAQVSSEKVNPTNDGFVFENDTVKITYRFWANRGKMEYDVFNKTAAPLYVDWKTSAFIPNSKMVSYWRDETNTDAATVGIWSRNVGTTASKTKSIRMERIGVIPPGSMLTQSEYSLANKYADLPKSGTFSFSNSPLTFRNYLTFSTNEKFEGKPFTIDNNFYISEIKTTSENKYPKYKSPKSFYYVISFK